MHAQIGSTPQLEQRICLSGHTGILWYEDLDCPLCLALAKIARMEREITNLDLEIERRDRESC